MVNSSIRKTRSFTINDVQNKNLIIKMLNYEEKIYKSEQGQNLFLEKYNLAMNTLIVEKIIIRIVLNYFDFDNDESDIENYKKIFKFYYKNENEYDREVMNAVHYFRENKCLFYKTPHIQVGQKIPNCKLFRINGKDSDNLYDIIKRDQHKHTLLAAFSLS